MRPTLDRVARMLRDGDARVSPIELFYDLVYVFAVTQLSHLLVQHHGVDGAIQTTVLLAMVWQVWVYTTWMTNYLDPERQPVRIALVALMLGGLVLAAAVPTAFSRRGLLVALLYVGLQAGRSIFIIWATPGSPLRPAFVRILAWTLFGSVAMVLGAVVHGHARELLWAAGVAIELVGASVGFSTPGIGRSQTSEWTIDGGHFAERCQAFVLIALGESIVVIGATLAGLLGADSHGHTAQYVAFGFAFVATVALWWIYFDTAAEASAHVIAESDDPGRLGRSAFHWVHPVIVAGVIVAAAADDIVLRDPSRHGVMATAWLVVGGAALFLAGHAVFKALVWRIVPWSRVIAVLILLALLAVAPHVSALTLGIATVVVVISVVVDDRIRHRSVLEVEPTPPPTPS